MAVWAQTGSGALVTARTLSSGTWSKPATLYTPSTICRFAGKRCTVESVEPRSLVVNDAGQGFFAVIQHINGPDRVACDRATAGRVSTHRTGGTIGTLTMAFGGCPSNAGKVPEAVTAIAPDGTATLAYTTVTPRSPDQDQIFFARFPRGATSSAALAPSDRSRSKRPSVTGLSVGIDGAGNASLAFRSGEWPAVIRSIDLVASGGETDLLVSVRGGVGVPTLSVSADGSQSIVYDGWAGSPGQWVHGVVVQTRAVAGQPWSAPAIAP